MWLGWEGRVSVVGVGGEGECGRDERGGCVVGVGGVGECGRGGRGG